MRYVRPLFLLCFLGLLPLTLASAQSTPLLGFTEEQSVAQRNLEHQYDALLRADNLRSWMVRMSARPHHVSSPYGKENAEFMAAQFRSWGYDTEIEVFHILFPTPKVRHLEMLEPIPFKATLWERTLVEDRTSDQHDEGLPPYNAYSVDGDVTGELVYVNYGIPQDYEELARRGIDVEGKIVIARYGGSWRGIKPKVAAEHGAIGCILYSDPRDDGYFRGDVYPEGAFKNETGAQRGSVADMPFFPGDPLTPGIGATENAERLDIADAPTLTKIPVLPISYSDALPLLKAMEGPVAPAAWRGALPITYHLGPGPAKVRLQLAFNWDIVPAYNVVARMEGSERPDQWVMRGNHHDAWVHGAQDPVSGMVALMEEARAIAELAKAGSPPKRTILYAAWDAEEPGLLGSTEWVEFHADELREKLVVYINTDGNGRGFLNAGGSHTLERFFNQISPEVIDPQKGISVGDRARSYRMVRGNTSQRKQAESGGDLRLSPLGSGSDYTPFLQHLGIASLNLSFGGESSGGSYHTMYDSFDHYTRFGDTTFEYGIALAKTAGRATLRLANADLLPFSFQNFTSNVSTYIEEIETLAGTMREETARENRLIEGKHYDLVADPTRPYVVPEPKDPVPYFNFAPLQNALAHLKEESVRFDEHLLSFLASEQTLSLESKQELDRLLYTSERVLTREEGLPRRSWFKHHIYAPGFYTGYGVKTLPGVREAIEQRSWEETEAQIQIAADVLSRFTQQIEEARAMLESATSGHSH